MYKFKRKQLIIIFFVFVVILEFFVPIKTIIENKLILSNGEEFRFVTKPIDPRDAFRGKYIQLGFENNTVVLDNKYQNKAEKRIRTIYLSFSKNSDGFAYPSHASLKKPNNNDNNAYLKISEQDFAFSNSNILQIEIRYPFDRFYVQENLATKAESLYNKNNESAKTYAIVKIRNGRGLLEHVIVDGVPITKAIFNQ